MTETGQPNPERSEREPGWPEKVLRVHAALDERQIPHAFGGAIAVNYHREPRSTLDIDINIWLGPEDRADVLATLDDLFEGLPDKEDVVRRIARDGQVRTKWGSTHVDLFFANTAFHNSMAERAERQEFEGVPIPVLSIEDLLICKVLFDRPKDWVDVAAVVRARGNELDAGYMQSWLSRFLPSDDERIRHLRGLLGAG